MTYAPAGNDGWHGCVRVRRGQETASHASATDRPRDALSAPIDRRCEGSSVQVQVGISLIARESAGRVPASPVIPSPDEGYRYGGGRFATCRGQIANLSHQSDSDHPDL